MPVSNVGQDVYAPSSLRGDHFQLVDGHDRPRNNPMAKLKTSDNSGLKCVYIHAQCGRGNSQLRDRVFGLSTHRAPEAGGRRLGLE